MGANKGIAVVAGEETVAQGCEGRGGEGEGEGVVVVFFSADAVVAAAAAADAAEGKAIEGV